jgi:hypothetical protein
MRMSNLRVQFHRTVRVAEGKAPSNLPPSLGVMEFARVKEFKANCPSDWDEDGYFAPLHETEAMWMSFAPSAPVAILVGAGGINALTGEKLGTKLENGNYLVAPPQPWLDGWKDKDGTVYQFVATAHKKGDGNTVAEQLIGAESKTGAIGLAVFHARKGAIVTPEPIPVTHKFMSFDGSDSVDIAADMSGGASATMIWSGGGHTYGATGMSVGMSVNTVKCSGTMTSLMANTASSLVKHALAPSGRGSTAKMMRHADSPKRPIPTAHVDAVMAEMGIGKGGKIIQKIYEDPYGLNVWETKPARVMAIYLVNAEMYAEITGTAIPKPAVHDTYTGPWFGLKDDDKKDVAGSDKFAGLKSAAFPGDTTNVTDDKWEDVPVDV